MTQKDPYVDVKSLPESIQEALHSNGYHRDNLQVLAREEYTLRPPSEQGKRGFVVACNLSTGETKTVLGSWGGSNMFVQTVDDNTTSMKIPPGVVFILGYGKTSGSPGYAYLVASPKTLDPVLLPVTADVTEREAKILAIFRALKSSYRKEYLSGMGAKDTEVDSLVTRGYLKRNKAGATSITTSGRNASSKNYY